jgi:chemotaxis family two-component system response regulator Rcp1
MGVLDQHREIRVLIVDDSPADVRLLVEAFREVEASVNIRIAKDGAQALMMLYAGPGQDHWAPDLVVLDLNLPKVGGHDVLARLKSDPAKVGIPVIVLSSSHVDSDIRQAYDAHANAYVRKPTTLEGLLSTVNGLKSFWIDTARLPKRKYPSDPA